MFDQLIETPVSNIFGEQLETYPELTLIQPVVADEVVNEVVIGDPNLPPIQYTVNDIEKSLLTEEPILSQLGLNSFLTLSFFNRIDGTPFNDFLIGTLGGDIIFAKQGDDVIIALAGNDIVFGEDGDDIIFGGPNSAGIPDNDIIFGGNGNDTVYAGEGNDFIIGGSGKDTVDYSLVNQGITLEAAGIINKGSAGTDQIFEIEKIIGNASQTNTIDGSTGTGTASFNVDLAKDSLTVVGTPIGNLEFIVENFIDVIGTNNQDTIIGSQANNQLMAEGGNDFIEASAGDDIIDGGLSFDTVDYQNLGQAITLEAGGKVNKGSLGTDQLNEVERIIGDGTKANKIDGSTGTGTASFKVDLAKESLTVVGTPIGDLEFTVENFIDVIGTSNDDVIVGNNSANNITGGKGNDELSGLAGKDTINGVDPTSKLAGFGEVDILTGGGDQDVFVLGDQKQAYYVGGGSQDLAIITDFKTGFDKIQLNGSLMDYVLLGTTSSTSIIRRSSILSDSISQTELITKPSLSFDLVGTVSSTINTATDLIFV
ncbi:MAG: calcium-binding protein [Crocosphaera sp.]|nr:calcium-binding protein [Crocosphaera sp.]